MISIICPNGLSRKIGLNEVREKLKFFSEVNNVLNYSLKNITFDHRFTKPITVTGYDILQILISTNQEVIFSTYSQSYFTWKFIPVNAFKPSHRADFVYFNTRQLNRRSPKEWEQTIWHELIHVADHLSEMRFDHGSREHGDDHENDLSGKDEAAPVKLARYLSAMSLPENYKRVHNV